MNGKELAASIIGNAQRISDDKSIKDTDILDVVKSNIFKFSTDNGGMITTANIMPTFKLIFEGGGSNLKHIEIEKCQISPSELLSGDNSKLTSKAKDKLDARLSNRVIKAFTCSIAQMLGFNQITSTLLRDPVWLAMSSGTLSESAASKRTIAGTIKEATDAVFIGSDAAAARLTERHHDLVSINMAFEARNRAIEQETKRLNDLEGHLETERSRGLLIEAAHTARMLEISNQREQLKIQRKDLEAVRLFATGAEIGAATADQRRILDELLAANARASSALMSGIASMTPMPPAIAAPTPIAGIYPTSTPLYTAPRAGSGAMPSAPAISYPFSTLGT